MNKEDKILDKELEKKVGKNEEIKRMLEYKVFLNKAFSEYDTYIRNNNICKNVRMTDIDCYNCDNWYHKEENGEYRAYCYNKSWGQIFENIYGLCGESENYRFWIPIKCDKLHDMLNTKNKKE